ncbi:MAG: hypothetical protein ABW196_05775 [Solirubrobacterales bacterium]
MIGTYAAVLAVCGASLVIGQAAIALCGVKRWSWLAPAVGLALICAIAWATVRMPGDGLVTAIAIPLLAVGAAVYLRGRLEGGGEALRSGLAVAFAALLAASLPFAVEGHFGILGTGFNPDMSQHLLATDRLADGAGSQLLNQGYPLGPHAIVVALDKGLGIGLVQGFSGLTIAVAILAPLTALAAFADQPRLRGIAAALVVGLPYLVASYFAQGAFKETIQALFVLAFVLALRESGRTWQDLPLRFVPAAILAIGSIYVYSFPALLWLGAIAAIWLFVDWASARYASPAGGAVGGTTPEEALATGRGGGSPAVTGPAGHRAMSLALIVFLVGALPELGRMIDFQQFETFDPSGPGLGNLFGQVSPFTALGIWFSGDFRLAPGNGAMPAFAYFAGAAFASLLLIYGLVVSWRRRETTILAGVLAVALLYAAARVGGTPYTSAKALEMAAPLATLAIVLPLLRRPVTVLYLALAGLCSLLAFANAPVGPTSYSPALTGLRPLLAGGSTLVLAPDSLLADEQGERYIVWELRGGHVCIEPESAAGGPPPTGVKYVITSGASAPPPFNQLTLRERAGTYVLWERRGVVRSPGPCPLIAVRQVRSGAK